jgi:dienelactone hydrolase
MRILPALLTLPLLVPSALHAAPVASVFGGRVPCVVHASGVQFCNGSVTNRVESWDGVPLDVTVTLPPAAQTGPFPLIVDLHGWGGSKSTAAQVARAQDGYVVLSYTARGFQQSCGFPASRTPDPSLSNPNVCNERGWVHLSDMRYEARDTQHLAGLLADEGLVIPDKVGVTGVSYGGGQSAILGMLNDRVALPDGTLVPWVSPGGKPMRIAAAAPMIPWTDLGQALTPTGRGLDYLVDNPYGDRAGIQKQSWNNALYLSGFATGFYAPEGVDPSADLIGWNARISAGEPYDGTPQSADLIREVTTYHSAYYVDDSTPPAPILIYDAWTDDLFPGDEATRLFRKITTRHPGAEIAMILGDGFGHPRAGLGSSAVPIGDRIDAFFRRHLKGEGGPLPRVETWTQGCRGAAAEGPFFSDTWEAAHPGEVRFSDAKPQSFDEKGGDPANAAATDPLNGPACRTVPAATDPGAATWTLPAATGAGYTLMGAPTIIANYEVQGSYATIAARLWDVAPDGQQTLVTHGLFRPRTDNAGPLPIQLHPNGWRFEAGHRPKLEMLGQSAPYGRASNGTFTITVTNLELRLPVRETPGGVVQAPAAPVLPPSAVEPLDVGPPPCAPTPAECTAARSGRLVVAGQRLTWKWTGSAGDGFGNPAATNAYSLCVYDAEGLRWRAELPAAGTCNAKKPRACWTPKRGGGFGYADPERTPDGVESLALKRSGNGRATITLKASGGAVRLGSFPLPQPVRVQLQSAWGGCWDATYSTPAQRNANGRFVDRAD